MSTARNHVSSRWLRRLLPRQASPSSRRLRAAVLAPVLAASIGAGLAAAQPADAAVSAPRFLSVVVPCKSAADPDILRSVTPAHHAASQNGSSAFARPCWTRTG
ncbi:hypothetical protein [Pseudofrankia sp. BMG5.36]|uniref:hypothetical protein n=1 Tax=Pseudofrankia sp. BMG5.36 TaxID=1834512 RepID=UPI0008DA6625|nr:hypothetical protein [Pseudofrankia sp. BMG5.36]OHV47160.1 hypothetical protein BCD48_19915 [Pseudofrankia sp. BMG5.36]